MAKPAGKTSRKGVPASVAPELEEIAEQIGSFIQYWGFKKIHGRIWTHIFLSDYPLDAAELMRRCKISKALASISLRDLLDYRVILESGKTPEGTQGYRANPDIPDVIFGVLRAREKKMLSQIHSAHRLLKNLPNAEVTSQKLDPARIKSLGEMIEFAENGLEQVLALAAFDFSKFEVLQAPSQK